MLKNHYKTLNIDFAASLAEVKTAYRKLALLYHPDKTDNELMKARFAEIKDAYEVLSNPVKRKQYDLTFDNFSYKKEVNLTPYQLLQKAQELQGKINQLDPHRMDLDRLEFDITELLSDRNVNTLNRTEDRSLVQQFVVVLMETARPLSSKQFKPISEHLYPLADDVTREKINVFMRSHTWDNRWDNYKLLFAIVGGVLLCLLVYFLGK